MENAIVDQFGNLQVMTSYNCVNMEKLVQDLSSALEESSKARSSEMVMDHVIRRQNRKRRVLKRRSLSNPGSMLTEYGNMSEASLSSFDDAALKDYFENVALQSDSDDIIITKRLSTCSLPVLNNLSLHESDSVTETLSPMRHRRRRKFKQMAVDPEPGPEPGAPLIRPKHKRMKSRTTSQNKEISSPGVLSQSNTSRKRPITRDVAMQDEENIDRVMECQLQAEDSSSLGSSDTDDGIFTFDEGQDGDDEQSDFFHESGPTYGIPGIIPWWEKEKQQNDDTDPVFEKILKGTFEYMPRSSQNTYKARVGKLVNKHDKDTASGRKRYKGRGSRSRVSSKSMATTRYSLWPMSGNSSHSSEVKRRRKTPSPCVAVAPSEGFVGASAQPLPESNIGRQMLQNMGWSPGDGLGADGTGIKHPVVAYLRPRRQGLGHSKQTKSS